MRKLLKQIDFLGYNFSIKINSENGYKSILGGFISILIIILSSIMTFVLGIEIFIKSEPLVVNSQVINTEFGPYNLTKISTDIQFFIGLEYPNFTYYKDHSVFTISAEESIVEYIVKNGTTMESLKTRNVNLIKCSDIYNNSDIDEENLHIPLDLFFCVDPNENAQIMGFWGSKISKSLKVKLQKCKNETNSNIVCKSKEEINEIIQNGIISIYASDYLINQKNYSQPTKKYFRDVYNYLSSNDGLIYVIAYSDFMFKSDTGFMYPSFTTWNIPMISDIKNSYSFGEEDMFAFINFQGFKLAQTYQRSYSKIQDILTKVGGLIKALTMIGFSINYIFSKPFFIIDNILEAHNLQKPIKLATLNSRASFNILKFNSNKNYKNKKNLNNISINSSYKEHLKNIHNISDKELFMKKDLEINSSKNQIFISKNERRKKPHINHTLRCRSFHKMALQLNSNLNSDKKDHSLRHNQNIINSSKIYLNREEDSRKRNEVIIEKNANNINYNFKNNKFNINFNCINNSNDKNNDNNVNKKILPARKQSTALKKISKKNSFSRFILFKYYWCPKSNSKVKSIFKFKESLIDKVLSLETFNKIYFDLEMLKLLNLNISDVRSLDEIYFNLFSEKDIYEKLRKYLYMESHNNPLQKDYAIYVCFKEEDEDFKKKINYFQKPCESGTLNLLN